MQTRRKINMMRLKLKEKKTYKAPKIMLTRNMKREKTKSMRV